MSKTPLISAYSNGLMVSRRHMENIPDLKFNSTDFIALIDLIKEYLVYNYTELAELELTISREVKDPQLSELALGLVHAASSNQRVEKEVLIKLVEFLEYTYDAMYLHAEVDQEKSDQAYTFLTEKEIHQGRYQQELIKALEVLTNFLEKNNIHKFKQTDNIAELVLDTANMKPVERFRLLFNHLLDGKGYGNIDNCQDLADKILESLPAEKIEEHAAASAFTRQDYVEVTNVQDMQTKVITQHLKPLMIELKQKVIDPLLKEVDITDEVDIYQMLDKYLVRIYSKLVLSLNFGNEFVADLLTTLKHVFGTPSYSVDGEQGKSKFPLLEEYK